MKRLICLSVAIFTFLVLLVPLQISAVIPSQRMCIDTPLSNAVISNTISNTVNGWALNSSGIKEVDIEFDGGSYKKITSGLSRADVAIVYPEYPGANKSGYTYTIPKGTLKTGAHTFTVKAVGINGQKETFSRTIQVKALNPYLCLDTPVSNQVFSVSSAISFSGWAINASGIRSVDVTVDNVKHAATINLKRPDVAKVYSDYPGDANSGYSYTLSPNSIGAGKHTVTITSYGNDGSSQTILKAFSAVVPAPRSNIDTPLNGAVSGDNKDITVSGWALNWSGVKEVDVYQDNGQTATAVVGTGISRPDVAKAYPGYPDNGTSGYSVTLPIGNFTRGTHTITAVAVGNDGTTSTVMHTITVQRYQMSLDSHPQYLNGTLSLTGWAVNAGTVKSVNLYVDGVYESAAETGLSRSDIASIYEFYPNAADSGFEFNNIKITNLSTGSHTFTVVAQGNDGSSQSVSFTAVKQPPVTVIEQPANNISTGGTVTVSGYALNATGITSVNVSIDGGIALSASIVPNSDPVGKYSGYENMSDSGFTVNIDISQYSTGKHTATISATGADGTTTSASTIIYNQGEITYTSYSESLSAEETTQLKGNPGPAYYSNGWKYIDATIDGYFYYKSNSGGSTTYTWVNDSTPYTVYNTIYNQFLNYINPTDLVNNNTDIYQFMKLTYVDGVSVQGLNSFFSANGVLAGMGQTFIDAGKEYNVNPVYLAMHSIEETGNGTSALAKGMVVNAGSYKVDGSTYTVAATGTYYNLYSVLAYDDNANLDGSEYAGYQGWNTVQKAIYGGAQWIANNYINKSGSSSQNTLYKMRWDPAQPGVLQYATDILWAHNSAALIKQYYDSYTSGALTFDVPRYS